MEGQCGLVGEILSSERHHQSGMDFELQGPGQDPTEKKMSKRFYTCAQKISTFRLNGLYVC